MRESIVNQLSGEAWVPTAFVDQLRTLERNVFRLDNAIASLKADLKQTKGSRDKAIAELRSAMREAKSIKSGQAKKGFPTSRADRDALNSLSDPKSRASLDAQRAAAAAKNAKA